MRELPLTNIPKTIKNTKNKKPEIFKEMQNHKDYEGTASDKHTKKIKNQNFFYEMQNHKDSEGTASYKHTKQHIHNMEC